MAVTINTNADDCMSMYFSTVKLAIDVLIFVIKIKFYFNK